MVRRLETTFAHDPLPYVDLLSAWENLETVSQLDDLAWLLALTLLEVFVFNGTQRLRLIVLIQEVNIPIDGKERRVLQDLVKRQSNFGLHHASVAVLGWTCANRAELLVSSHVPYKFYNERRELALGSHCHHPIFVRAESVPPKVFRVREEFLLGKVEHEPRSHPYFLVEHPAGSGLIYKHEQRLPECLCLIFSSLSDVNFLLDDLPVYEIDQILFWQQILYLLQACIKFLGPSDHILVKHWVVSALGVIKRLVQLKLRELVILGFHFNRLTERNRLML